MRLLAVTILFAGCIACHAEDPLNTLSATNLLQKDVKELEAILMSADDLIRIYEQEVIQDPPRRIPSDTKVDLVADIMIRQVEIWRVRQKDHDRFKEQIEKPELKLSTSLETPKQTKPNKTQEGVAEENGKP